MQETSGRHCKLVRGTVWIALAASPSSSATTNAAAGAPDGLDLAKLRVLTNHTSTMTDNGQFTQTYRVYSPNDWEVFEGKPTPLSVNVGGSTYLDVPNVSGTTVTYSWHRSGSAQPYAQSPYPSYAAGFAALTHVSGAKLVRAGAYSQAGIAGHLWHFAAAAPGAVFPHVSACIADQSGALLTYDQAPIQTFAVTIQLLG